MSELKSYLKVSLPLRDVVCGLILKNGSLFLGFDDGKVEIWSENSNCPCFFESGWRKEKKKKGKPSDLTPSDLEQLLRYSIERSQKEIDPWKRISNIYAHEDQLTCCCTNNNNSNILTADQRGQVVVWNLFRNDTDEFSIRHDILFCGEGPILDIAFSLDSAIIATMTTRSITTWNFRTAQQLTITKGKDFTKLCFIPHIDTLPPYPLVVCCESSVGVWKKATKRNSYKLLKNFKGHKDLVQSCLWLVSGFRGEQPPVLTKKKKAISDPSSPALSSSRGSPPPPSTLLLSAELSDVLVTISYDGSMKFWNVESASLLKTVQVSLAQPLQQLSAPLSGSLVSTTTSEGKISLYDNRGEEIHHFEPGAELPENETVKMCVWDKIGSTMACISEQSVKLFQSRTIQQDKEDIRFCQEQPSGLLGIQSASLKQLFQFLTSPNCSTLFRDTFLLTYRSFSDPQTLLFYLLSFYCEKINLIDDQSTYLGYCGGCNEVVYVLKKWVNEHLYDFLLDGMVDCLVLFCDLVGKNEDKRSKEHVSLIRSIIPKNKIETKNSPLAGPLSHRNSMLINDPETWEEGDIKFLAKQITYWMMSSFLEIRPQEVSDYLKDENSSSSSNVRKVIDQYKTISKWTTSIICKQTKQTERLKTVTSLLKLLRRFYKLNNFGASVAMISSLNSSVVQLENSLKHLKDQSLKKDFEQIKLKLSLKKSYKSIREQFQRSAPFLPFIENCLTSLAETLGGGEGCGEGIIDFSKMYLLADVLSDIQDSQQEYPDIQPDDNFISKLDFGIFKIASQEENSELAKCMETSDPEAVIEELLSTNKALKARLSQVETTLKKYHQREQERKRRKRRKGEVAAEESGEDSDSDFDLLEERERGKEEGESEGERYFLSLMRSEKDLKQTVVELRNLLSGCCCDQKQPKKQPLKFPSNSEELNLSSSPKSPASSLSSSSVTSFSPPPQTCNPTPPSPLHLNSRSVSNPVVETGSNSNSSALISSPSQQDMKGESKRKRSGSKSKQKLAGSKGAKEK